MEPESSISVSALTEAEVLLGLGRRPSDKTRKVFTEFMTKVTYAASDSKAAASYSYLGDAMGRARLSLALIDLLIASHAHALGATLVTHDRAMHRLQE